MFKKPLVIAALAGLVACMEPGGNIAYGNNNGPHINDGECDDPRFTGGGMASSLNNDNIKADAADCQNLIAAGKIRLQRTAAQWDRAQCSAVNFGNNSSEWANDGECDDARFTGPGTDDIMLSSDTGRDANDCRALCQTGEVWVK